MQVRVATFQRLSHPCPHDRHLRRSNTAVGLMKMNCSISTQQDVHFGQFRPSVGANTPRIFSFQSCDSSIRHPMERRSLSTSRRSHATSSTRKATKSGFSGLVEKGLSANFRNSAISASVNVLTIHTLKRFAFASADMVTFTPDDRRSIGGGAVSLSTGRVIGRVGSGERGIGGATGSMDMRGVLRAIH